MNAQDYANEIESPCLFWAGNGCPAGQTIALLNETELPFDLSEIEGEVTGGIFEANNLVGPHERGDHRCGWKFHDWRHNIVYKVQIFSDAKIFADQLEEMETA